MLPQKPMLNEQQASAAVSGAPARPRTAEVTAAHRALTLVLFFASGFAGLVYEVLWMKELGLLFGSTAQAAATTLAAFFLGLVAGARTWGGRAERMKRPLRAYAWLEAGVAVCAMLYFLLLDAYYALYAPLFRLLGDRAELFLLVKFLLACGVLFPPSFFMGGTLPVMSQHLVRRRDALGRTASLLYGVNTLGAAAGAYAAGFHLPRILGFNNAYAAAIATTSAVAVAAWLLGGRPAPPVKSARPAGNVMKAGQGPGALITARTIFALAFLSGFATMSLEVLWTRMFAQVLQNSVYTFSTILVTFLGALAAGACASGYLIRRGFPPPVVLLILLSLSGLLAGITPFVFFFLTDGLSYMGGGLGFAAYIAASFRMAALVLFIPGVLLGSLFPYLLKLAESFARPAGRTVGDLASINMLGAVAGALSAGFVLLDLLGLWASIRLVSALYFAAAFLVAYRMQARRGLFHLAPVAGLLLLVSVLDPSRLPVVKVDSVEKGESVVEVWESSSGIVSVIRQADSLRIKLDNDYSLGATHAITYQERRTHLPLLLHPKPDAVFYLGMGTGITAGASLAHPVKRVVVTELSPAVVEAARKYFRPYIHGLFEDARVKVVAEDGRNYLFGTAQTFDVIVGDLFLPWKAGVGNLYSREHFKAALARLNPGGFYIQWLPLYQISEDEFGVVAKTMLEVFPLVTVWRGSFAPGWESVGIIGHRDVGPLDRAALIRRLEQAGWFELRDQPPEELGELPATEATRVNLGDLIVYYCGNLSTGSKLLERYPVNTDDRPVIEYEAPVTHRRKKAHQLSWFIGRSFIGFLNDLLALSPPGRDPYLANFPDRDKKFVSAGLHYYRAMVFQEEGDIQAAKSALGSYYDLAGLVEGEGLTGGQAEQAMTRKEINQLIATYEKRIRDLQRFLEEE